MNDDSFDYIIEAEKIRKITIQKLKEEKDRELARKLKESKVDVAKTQKGANDLLSWGEF